MSVEPGGDPRTTGQGTPVNVITTARLELVLMSVSFMEALRASDFVTAEQEIGAGVPHGMAADLEHFLEYRLAQVARDPVILEWLGRAMVLAGDDGTRRVIGSIGFHGPPDDSGRLEVGYRVEPAFRRRGYAIEAVRALFDWATECHGVTRFVASVSPTNEASLSLIAQLGFREIGSQIDEIDGLELVFLLDRGQAVPAGRR